MRIRLVKTVPYFVSVGETKGLGRMNHYQILAGKEVVLNEKTTMKRNGHDCDTIPFSVGGISGFFLLTDIRDSYQILSEQK
ncbi:MAG: hypothetical protein HY507_02155 [Candidatus Zambryskibacteria bacterium]|nr:hypothetical protein [Candidatus Zambryskibacteria bacterium]